jgi:uncharacterized membrane protein YphA (DoxX/SURF4 family)
LFVLRAAVGITAIAEGAVSLTGGGRPLAVAIGGLVALGCGAMLFLGFLTPIAVVALGASRIGLALSSSLQGLPAPSPAMHALVLAVIFALALLGPGALSIDAYLFGRREIVFKHR